ncbi:hypothetical protein HY988_04350 [Candidatus Micrarchaeota archaeon]|nr:hypothetical protein [Candidatus Micrarchaeota archaeon]
MRGERHRFGQRTKHSGLGFAPLLRGVLKWEQINYTNQFVNWPLGGKHAGKKFYHDLSEWLAHE